MIAVQVALHEVLFPLRGHDIDSVHRQTQTLIPDLKRCDAKLLYRVEGTVARCRSVIPFERARNLLEVELEVGNHYAFQLRANTVKAVRQEDGKVSKRVPDHDWDGWIAQRSHGFEIVSLWKRQAPKAVGIRGGHMITFTGVDYAGILRCTDVDELHRALTEGIGHGKAYGFGMLILEAL